MPRSDGSLRCFVLSFFTTLLKFLFFPASLSLSQDFPIRFLFGRIANMNKPTLGLKHVINFVHYFYKWRISFIDLPEIPRFVMKSVKSSKVMNVVSSVRV